MSKICWIMRGIPGSGKSHWVRNRVIENKTSSCTVSADVFHYTHPEPVNGVMLPPVYNFQPSRAGWAHQQCLLEFIKEIQFGWQEMFVDNTNTQVWELAPYARIAEAFDYTVKIIRIVCDVETAIKRNTHNVPSEQIWKMHLRMENLPSHWTETPVFTGGIK